MKNTKTNVLKWRSILAIIALVAVIGFSFVGCDNGTTPPPYTPTNTGIAPTIITSSLLNGTVGTAYSQILTASGDTPITWSLDSGSLPTGLTLSVSGTISGTPTAAATSTFTVKAVNIAGSDKKQLSITIAAANLSLDGVWESVSWSGDQVIISGSTGVNSMFTVNPGTIRADAVGKGYVGVGKTCWRNLSKTGNLTWSGQWIAIRYYTSSPNVAIGTTWVDGTWTLSADGQTLVVGDAQGSSTWKRMPY